MSCSLDLPAAAAPREDLFSSGGAPAKSLGGTAKGGFPDLRVPNGSDCALDGRGVLSWSGVL